MGPYKGSVRPYKDIIYLSLGNSNSLEFVMDYANVGFQFERLMTGRNLSDSHDLRSFEVLQMMKVAGYNVLFVCEIDAMDGSGMPVELKVGNPRNFAMKVMFQMLAQGSETLIMADRKGPHLHGVFNVTLDDLVREHDAEKMASAEANITEALNVLKNSPDITSGTCTELDFECGVMMLKPHTANRDFVPAATVIEELLHK
eukprot:gnl/TRDRNA2_/TRDRNA2_158345_c0_seq3.p1 gnl/TRDRNA2_/TRDRNA2_158345_c0~~gnl/TRDRNA2_/TRDRNA2_158345_c0_seq3.p1  ORF type:complete len:201 (+),score=34.49 gnl/TRDRNA2_/TRDRNA2_158345_c0_seq3:62-664(+)